MDAKVTLSFNEDIIARAKEYAKEQGISLSRLTEILLRKVTTGNYPNFEDMPIANWVNMVSESESEYIKTPRKSADMKSEYFNSRK